MALTKYAEEIREKIEENMARREERIQQSCKPQHSATEAATEKKKKDGMKQMKFADASYFLW